MPIARSTFAGVATGAVLLAGAVGFGVGLPKVVDEPDKASATDLPALPDRLDDRFVALAALTTDDTGGTSSAEELKTVAEGALKSESEASSNLAAMYDGAVARSYIDAKALAGAAQSQARPAQFAVTVVPGDAGLVIPSGPFPIEQSGTHYELKELDGRRCSLIWSEPLDPTTGAPTGAEPDGSNYQVECRAERDGLTYDLYSSGLKPEEAVQYLDLVLEKTGDDA